MPYLELLGSCVITRKCVKISCFDAVKRCAVSKELGKHRTFENCSVNTVDYTPRSHICTATRATFTSNNSS